MSRSSGEAGPIVDAEVHIHENPAELAEHAEGLLRRAMEGRAPVERRLDTPGLSPLTDYDPPIGFDPLEEPHVVRTVEQLRDDLDSLGVDAAVVFTGRLLDQAAIQQPGEPLEIARTYNRYLQARWLDPARGIFGAIMAAAQDPRGSAHEIEQYADVPGVAAVSLPMACVYPLWGHRQYDPIYAAAEAANLPVVLHGFTRVYPVFPHQLEQFDTALAKQTLSKPFSAMANLTSMTTTGVFARFPELKVMFAECGVSWLPFLMWRLDHQYQWLQHELPFYDEKPSWYLRNQVYATTHGLEADNDPQTLEALIRSIGGPDRVLFATDWPHYDADSVERVSKLPLPDGWAQRILSGNAQEVFKLTGLTTRAARAKV